MYDTSLTSMASFDVPYAIVCQHTNSINIFSVSYEDRNYTTKTSRTEPEKPIVDSQTRELKELENRLLDFMNAETGWDGDSAVAAKAETVMDAFKFLSNIQDREAPLPGASMGSDGIIGLAWRSKDARIILDFDGSHQYYGVMKIVDGAKILIEPTHVDDNIPAEILNVINQYFLV